MRTLCFLFFIGPLFCHAQTGIKEIAGKWQEGSRSKKKDIPLDFTDTLRLEIREDGFMMVRHANGATITGEAEIKGSKLKLEHISFTIIESNMDKLVLNDNEGDHLFRKLPEFTNAPVTKRIPGADVGKKDLSNTTIQGKWSCYKKTDPEFSRRKFYLRSIDFREKAKEGVYKGSVSFNNSDSVYSVDAVLSFNDSELLMRSEKELWKADIQKSDGDELILLSGNIHYFMKQFGKK